MKPRDTAATRTSKNVARNQRIAQMLIDVVREQHPHDGPRSALQLIRGLALRAQVLRMPPAAFDCPNGQDALTAIATSMSRAAWVTLATGNAFVLSARWSKVVYIAGLEIPGPGLSAIERNRAADLPTFAPSPYPPKIFGKFMP